MAAECQSTETSWTGQSSIQLPGWSLLLSLTKTLGVLRLTNERIDDSGTGPMVLAIRPVICLADNPPDAGFMT